jgi:hypothetical protein
MEKNKCSEEERYEGKGYGRRNKDKWPNRSFENT